MEPRILAKHYLATALRVSGLLGCLHSAQRPSWRVLCYHRTIDPEQVNYGLQPGMFVRPASFKSQMELIARKFRVIPLSALSRTVLEGAPVDPRTVVITFDDGWLDNYEFAFPVLKRLGLPATVVLPTAYIGTSRMFWTDEVALAVAEAKRSPQTGAGLKESLSAGAISKGGLAKEGNEDLIAAARSMASISDLDHLVEYLKRATPSVRDATLQVLRLLRDSGGEPKEQRVFVNWDEVRAMGAAGVEFGSHSHEHHNLTELDETTLDSDIALSYQTLREHGISGTPPFCFPGGYFNAGCLAALKKAGVEFAATTTRSSSLSEQPKLLGRTLLHEDISATSALFLARLAGRPF